MIKGNQIVNSDEYIIEVSGKFSEEKYKFRIRLFSRKRKPILYCLTFPETFIEDEINGLKELTYLEQVVLCLAENHLLEIINPPKYSKTRDIKSRYWFREAKRRLEKRLNS